MPRSSRANAPLVAHSKTTESASVTDSGDEDEVVLKDGEQLHAWLPISGRRIDTILLAKDGT